MKASTSPRASAPTWCRWRQGWYPTPGGKAGYGKLVEVNHGNGYVTRYGHNSKITVEVGERVDRGNVIAKLGSSGRSTGPHLHFEVLRNGKVVDPAAYMEAAR